MGWSGYDIHVHVRVDAHGGEKEKRGEKAYEEFQKELEKLIQDERFNNDAIEVY